MQNSSNSGKWNVGYSSWYQDYPAPSDFLNVLLGCGNIHPNSDASPNIAAFCDQAIQSKINQAETMAATNPSGAAALWTQVDHADTNAGPWVDMFNPKQIDVLSQQRPRLLLEPAVVHPHRQALALVGAGRARRRVADGHSPGAGRG